MRVHFVEEEFVVDLLGFADAAAAAVGGDVHHLDPCCCQDFVEISGVSSNVRKVRKKKKKNVSCVSFMKENTKRMVLVQL